jgi:hypothetical protein
MPVQPANCRTNDDGVRAPALLQLTALDAVAHVAGALHDIGGAAVVDLPCDLGHGDIAIAEPLRA